MARGRKNSYGIGNNNSDMMIGGVILVIVVLVIIAIFVMRKKNKPDKLGCGKDSDCKHGQVCNDHNICVAKSSGSPCYQGLKSTSKESGGLQNTYCTQVGVETSPGQCPTGQYSQSDCNDKTFIQRKPYCN
jgi:hypothetical protein